MKRMHSLGVDKALTIDRHEHSTLARKRLRKLSSVVDSVVDRKSSHVRRKGIVLLVVRNTDSATEGDLHGSILLILDDKTTGVGACSVESDLHRDGWGLFT